MPKRKPFLQCPECGERIFESDEQCMSCEANLAEHRRQVRMEEEAEEEDLIAQAAARATAKQKAVKRDSPAAQARVSADYLARAGNASIVLGILGVIGGVVLENLWLAASGLIGGIFWFVIFWAASRLLSCIASLTESASNIENRVLHWEETQAIRNGLSRPDAH